jgi:hypothetical protein
MMAPGASLMALSDVLADVAFFLLGVGIILYALFRATTKQHTPIDLTIGKLGAVKMDFVAFLVCVGIVLAGVGVFFRYRGYESRLRELESSKAASETRFKELQFQIDRFKNYNLNVALSFRESVSHEGLKISQLVKPPGEKVFQLSDQIVVPTNSEEANNVVSITVGHLNKGDRLKFKVTMADKTWVSEEMEVPVVNLSMIEETRR